MRHGFPLVQAVKSLEVRRSGFRIDIGPPIAFQSGKVKLHLLESISGRKCGMGRERTVNMFSIPVKKHWMMLGLILIGAGCDPHSVSQPNPQVPRYLKITPTTLGTTWTVIGRDVQTKHAGILISSTTTHTLIDSTQGGAAVCEDCGNPILKIRKVSVDSHFSGIDWNKFQILDRIPDSARTLDSIVHLDTVVPMSGGEIWLETSSAGLVSQEVLGENRLSKEISVANSMGKGYDTALYADGIGAIFHTRGAYNPITWKKVEYLAGFNGQAVDGKGFYARKR
jgi:hypothetical protein